MTASPDQLAAVAAAIRAFFRQPDLRIDRDTVADDVDGWDSLAHASLVLDLETRFAVRLPGDKVFDLDSVGALADLIAQRLGR